MHVFKIILLFIIFSNHSFALSKFLLSTFDYKVKIENNLNSDELKLPPKTYHHLVSFYAYTQDFKEKIYCLNIFTKDKLEPGLLYLTETDENCERSLMSEKKLWESVYYNYEINFNSNKLYLKIDKTEFDISLINNKKMFHQKFSSHTAKNSFGSVMLGLGKVGKERVKIKDGEICRQVNNDCSISLDQCDQCQGGSYYFKNSQCQKIYSKACGINPCGKRGEVACLRGYLASGIKDYCIQDSPVGFCFDGSRVACVNETLICE
jgi:hypothetical protein